LYFSATMAATTKLTFYEHFDSSVHLHQSRVIQHKNGVMQMRWILNSK